MKLKIIPGREGDHIYSYDGIALAPTYCRSSVRNTVISSFIPMTFIG